ncbi:MAG TPA: hypothetical protein VGZ93_09360 [Candidatus Methylacidiphilales bacterium]|jgi:hypothetical protein|nr:hypothetical protein [Candidatus Methylacidiphilales bacterium]
MKYMKKAGNHDQIAKFSKLPNWGGRKFLTGKHEIHEEGRGNFLTELTKFFQINQIRKGKYSFSQVRFHVPHV